jgi:hypothetical protein
MLLVVNGMKVWESANGKEVTPSIWRRWISRTLFKLLLNSKSKHPCSIKEKGKEKMRDCRSCFHILKKRSRTVFRCPVCGPICKNCDIPLKTNGKSSHELFFSLPVCERPIRKSYKVPGAKK